jgi:hypothetical protein
MIKTSWSFQQIWNDSLAERDEWEVKPRQHIWASELGGSFIDRWHRMKGIEPTNPPNKRSFRKFEAGNMFEWVVNTVLKRAGLLISTQDYIKHKYPGLLEVTGKLDHRAGGKPDWDNAELTGDYPEFMKRASKKIVKSFKKKYPNGLNEIILESKSVGSMMFHRYETHKMPNPNHELQLFHYLKGTNTYEGHIIYISKDDLMIIEVGVFNVLKTETKYQADIEKMTEYLKSDKPPEKEKEITFDEVAGRFYLNWKITYSGYLTLIYGYETPADFEGHFKGKVASFNRTLGRVVDGKNMTELNKATIKEIKGTFDNYNEIIKIAKKKRKVTKNG